MTNTPPAAGPGAFSGPPRIRVSSPADLLAVVPRLLGFHPAASLVVIGAGPPRERIELAFRYDLPDPPDPRQAGEIAAHAVSVLRHRRLGTAIAVGYGPGSLVTPVADALAAALRSGGLRLQELLRVQDGRYWSYLCANPGCCPPEGVPFDAAASPAAAAMTVAGMVALPDRAALAGTVAPVTGAGRARHGAGHPPGPRPGRRAGRAGRRSPGGQPPGGRLLDAGRHAVQEAIATYRGGGRVTGDDQVAWLSVVLALLPVRDDAWARMDPEAALRAAHLRLWADLVRRSCRAYRPAPASLLAFTAWQSGDGALANIALDMALEADPGYSLALLLRDIMEAGVPPSAARLPMTPEQVAAGYAAAGYEAARRGPGRRPGPRERPRPARRRGAGGGRGGSAGPPAGDGPRGGATDYSGAGVRAESYRKVNFRAPFVRSARNMPSWACCARAQRPTGTERREGGVSDQTSPALAGEPDVAGAVAGALAGALPAGVREQHAAAVAAIREAYAAAPPGSKVRLAKRTSNLFRFPGPANGRRPWPRWTPRLSPGCCTSTRPPGPRSSAA